MSFRLAERQALKSTFRRHRLGAVIVKSGRVISTGYNKYGYTKELKQPTLHAEEMAIVKVLRQGLQHHLVGSDLYVTRFTPGGAIGISRPCTRCCALIRSVGISNILYSGADGYPVKLKVN